MPYIPLPDKPVHQLNSREMKVFRKWIGFEPGGGLIPYPTPEESTHRQKREAWKRRYAGKGASEPRLLVRQEQIRDAKANARRNSAARRWLERILNQAGIAADLPAGFFDAFIPELGPWNPLGNFCPACERTYWWKWDWRNPEGLTCPHCSSTFPDPRYPENDALDLPRTGKRYTFHVLDAERESPDWRLGERAKRFVGLPIHLSFSGIIRNMKIGWSLGQVEPLSMAYALTGKAVYARAIERILTRLAEVYPGYLLQSYFQDVVDADPGYATDKADALPTVFKRNACIGVYDGRYGYGHDKTTTRLTRVATGLWGCSRIAVELSGTGDAFLKCFQAYDLVKKVIPPEIRKRIEQDFLLELYLDVRAYEPITNKAGSVRCARVAFGVVYDSKAERDAGLNGFHRILESQYHPDGSMKESPIYGHKPIAEDLWKIPEILRGKMDLYGDGLYRKALEAHRDIATPLNTQPPMDDSYINFGIPTLTAEIAATRCGILIPGIGGPPSEFAILNTQLEKTVRRPGPGKALNRFYEGRKLACVGFGSGKSRVQMYVLGEDGLRGHRHAGALSIQLYAGGRDIFPDLGYICDHPGNQWVKATASHQTVVVDEKNSYPAGPARLIGFSGEGRGRFVDMAVELTSGATLRRALTLLRKEDGLPILIDLFDVEGGTWHDYNIRVDAPLGQLSLQGPELKPRRRSLYQDQSAYPLLNFRTGGRIEGGWTATWGRGKAKVQATILTPCAELITYASPAWHNQHEIAADPGKYYDVLALRNRKKSRFLVLYEVLSGPPKISGVLADDTPDQVDLRLRLSGGRVIQVIIPGSERNGREKSWEVCNIR